MNLYDDDDNKFARNVGDTRFIHFRFIYYKRIIFTRVDNIKTIKNPLKHALFEDKHSDRLKGDF